MRVPLISIYILLAPCGDDSFYCAVVHSVRRFRLCVANLRPRYGKHECLACFILSNTFWSACRYMGVLVCDVRKDSLV